MWARIVAVFCGTQRRLCFTPMPISATPPALRTGRTYPLRSAGFGVALALHLMGLYVALHTGVWADRQSAARQAPLQVRLLLLPMARREPPPASEPMDPPTAARPPARARAALAQPQPEAALPAIALPPAAEVPAAPAVTPIPAAAADSAAPLNLTLPRNAADPRGRRNPALEDPRSNIPQLTLEQRLAEAMGGDGEWVEEPIDAEHRRLRRGNTCIYLERPRAAQLDPFHPANRILPWQQGQPVRCR